MIRHSTLLRTPAPPAHARYSGLRHPAWLAPVWALWPLATLAQPSPGVGQIRTPGADAGWQACYAMQGSDHEQLRCFRQWAAGQPGMASGSPQAAPAGLPVAPLQPGEIPPAALAAAPQGSDEAGREVRLVPVPTAQDCKAQHYSQLSRFWELEPGTDCGLYTIRGYRPMSVMLASGTQLNRRPSSANPAYNSSLYEPYQNNEMFIQLSVRTKLAQGLLVNTPALRDSLWVGYTQRSYWQIFNSGLSRPFRNTDHEPELTYILPSDYALGGGWRYRVTGLSLVHHSNGKSDPLSRSWNRLAITAAIEKADQYTLTAQFWKRLPESEGSDNNSDLTRYYGRAELAGAWQVNRYHTLNFSLRNNLRASGKGSIKLGWMRVIGNPETSDLRWHAELFHGYGDTLLDYNHKRTVFRLGLSLLDW
jgi:phospholipase A1